MAESLLPIIPGNFPPSSPQEWGNGLSEFRQLPHPPPAHDKRAGMNAAHPLRHTGNIVTAGQHNETCLNSDNHPLQSPRNGGWRNVGAPSWRTFIEAPLTGAGVSHSHAITQLKYGNDARSPGRWNETAARVKCHAMTSSGLSDCGVPPVQKRRKEPLVPAASPVQEETKAGA